MSYAVDLESQCRKSGLHREVRLVASSILGVWKLRSFITEMVETGERSEAFGPEPRGTLILHPDGWMAALITPRVAADPARGAGQASAMPKLVAYSGRFRLEPPDKLVTSVDVAAITEWVGTDQSRTYRLDGDRLDIFTPPGRMPRLDAEPVTVVAILSWTREPATLAS
jgi:hypothetical protein